MSDTLPNIPLNSNEWQNLYSQSGIDVGLQVVIFNNGDSDVYYAIATTEPSLDNTAYKVLRPRDLPVVLDKSISGLWGLSPTDNGKLNISVYVPTDAAPQKTAFGELKVESMSPVTQISGHSGLLTNVLTVSDDLTNGTTSIIDNMYTCDSGTLADSFATVLTLRHLAYKSGMGAMCRLTALFSAGVAGNQQLCGFITNENALGFAYIGTEFGIAHVSNGHGELQELELTVAAAGAESATVTINDIGYTVNLSGGGTLAIDAYEIAVSLESQVPNYTFTSNESCVIAQAQLPRSQGVFAYSSATSTGVWVQEVAGQAVTVDFTPQSAWNIDTRISNNTDINLDPTKGNVYQVQFQSGFGDITFSIEDSVSGLPVEVHKIRYANNNVLPSLSNPTMRGGWISRNLGGTTSVRIQGESLGLFIEGVRIRDTLPTALFNEQTGIGSVPQSILIIRNRQSFAQKINRNDTFPLGVSLSTQATKFALFELVINPDFASPVTFQYKDKENSLVEFSNDKVNVTGGVTVSAGVVVAGSAVPLRFNLVSGQDSVILPNEVMAIVAQVPNGASSDCQATIVTQDDL